MFGSGFLQRNHEINYINGFAVFALQEALVIDHAQAGYGRRVGLTVTPSSQEKTGAGVQVYPHRARERPWPDR